MLNRFIIMFGSMSLLFTIGAARADLHSSGTFDLTSCGSGHSAVIDPATEHLYWSQGDQISFYHSNPPGGAFDMTWSKCVGMGGNDANTRFVDTVCQMYDKDGDEFIRRHRYSVDLKSGAWNSNLELFGGTGKYAGLKGQGKSERLASFDTKTPGLYAFCERYRGTYTLSR